jgi:hypothetical protein
VKVLAVMLSIIFLTTPVVAGADNIDDALALRGLAPGYPACAPITTDIVDYPVNDPDDNDRWSGRNARVRAHAARVCTDELVDAKENSGAIRMARGLLIDECAALVKHGITLKDCATPKARRP